MIACIESKWERRARLWGPAVIAACALLAYANSFTVPFVFDAENYLLNAENIRSLREIERAYSNAPTRPVGYISFALTYAAAEYDLTAWHLTNLAIHVAAACAVFGIARRAFLSPRLQATYGDAAARLALAIAVLWVVHPLNTQSVTYLYQRLESLMGMFYLLTLYAFVRYADSRNLAWAGASIASMLLSEGTKEVAVTAPLMVLWFDRVFLAAGWRELIRQRGLLHLAIFATLAWPAWLMASARDVYPQAGILDFSRISALQYARTQPEVIEHYLRLAVVPWPLNIDYAWPVQNDWLKIVPAATIIGVLLLATLVAAWKRPALGFLGAWWFIILAPTSSIAPIIDLAFEHRTYLSLIAAAALVVVGGYHLIGKLVARCGSEPATTTVCRFTAFVLLASGYASLTLLRNYDYRSTLALWTDVCRKAPHNPRAHYNRGVYLQTEGVESYDEAIVEYERALQLEPNYLDAYLNLGNMALFRGQFGPAIADFESALRIDPRHVASLKGIAEAWMRSGNDAAAVPYLNQLLVVEPSHGTARLMLDDIHARAAATGATASGTQKKP